MEISELQKEAYETAKSKGFFDEDKPDTHYCMMAVTEIGEYIQELRDGKKDLYVENGIPLGTSVELADAMIYLLSIAGRKGYDLQKAIELKMEWNKTRPYKHGKKF